MDQLINFKSLNESCEPPGEKRMRLSSSSCPPPPPHLVSAVQTTTGCGLVGLGEGRLYLFRVFNCSGASGETALQMLPLFVVLLLEYTMFCGLDVWDVLLAVRQGKCPRKIVTFVIAFINSICFFFFFSKNV